MTRKEILQELETLMKIDSGTLGGTENLDDYVQWDSMLIMGFIAVIQKKTGKVLDGQQVSDARTVEDLLGLVSPDTPSR
jgi:acyl carrier protein